MPSTQRMIDYGQSRTGQFRKSETYSRRGVHCEESYKVISRDDWPYQWPKLEILGQTVSLVKMYFIWNFWCSSCSANSVYDYCKFSSPAGDKCHFYRSSADRILEEFCQDLNNRTNLIFSGSVKEFECALLGYRLFSYSYFREWCRLPVIYFFSPFWTFF